MHVLDTNHLRELALSTRLGSRLQRRWDESGADVVTTVVSAEEITGGWLARIAAARTPVDEALAYEQLGQSIHFLARFMLLPMDEQAISRRTMLRRQGVRIGTMDLKIACICLEHDATLLTRNTVDFVKVPGLRIENWLD